MRICMILDHHFPPDIRIEKEARSLAAAGHTITLMCRNRGDQPESETIGGIRVNRIRYTPPKFLGGYSLSYHLRFVDLVWEKALEKGLEEHPADALHVHDLPMVKTCLRIGRRRKIRVVFDMHENWPEELIQGRKPREDNSWVRMRDRIRNFVLFNNRRYVRLEKEVIRKADRIIVVVDEMKDRLTSLGIDPLKITVVMNTSPGDTAFSIDPAGTDFPEWTGRFVVAYAGGFQSLRGLDTLVRAAAIARKRIPNILLLLMGQGDQEALLNLQCQSLDLAGHAVFTGWIPLEEMMRRLRRSDVCVIPHRVNPHTDTTIPHKLFQYMALAKPVVATPVAPIRRIVEETDCGIVVPDGSAEEMAEALVRLTDRRLAARLGENGRKAVEIRYHWEADSKKLVELYGSPTFAKN
ncbi:glycosyltransferase family 4 protein [bacterium]|nr:glycosyltransferase family 4 protein [bacterium]